MRQWGWGDGGETLFSLDARVYVVPSYLCDALEHDQLSPPDPTQASAHLCIKNTHSPAHPIAARTYNYKSSEEPLETRGTGRPNNAHIHITHTAHSTQDDKHT